MLRSGLELKTGRFKERKRFSEAETYNYLSTSTFNQKKEKLTDTGLYRFSRYWKLLLDGKLDIGWFGKEALPINFLIQI